MSNNIYDILKKMQCLETPKQSLTESKKSKPDFADLDKDGDKKEPMKKAAKEKGAIAEAVARVEKQLAEKYMGFKKTVAAIKKGGGAEDPEAVAAAIGRKKYGKAKFQKAAAAGKKLGEDYKSDMKAKDIASRAADFDADLKFVKSGGGHVDTGGTAYDRFGNPAFGVDTRNKLEKNRDYPVYRTPGFAGGNPDRPVQEDDIEESGLQAYLGKKKYGKEGMQALQKAGREGASKEKMAKIRARHDKMDEGNYNEEMLSAKQKEFAALADPKDKITYADKIAGAKKKQKDEGNEFSGELVKARAQGKDSFEVDGKSYPVKEGWDEMQSYLKKKEGPQPKGASGKIAGKRYGGSAQSDEPETDNETGEVAKKGRGRPKKDKFAK